MDTILTINLEKLFSKLELMHKSYMSKIQTIFDELLPYKKVRAKENKG
uniref:Uncharacterized protein n=1 Tax=Rhizophora mucronata TaxID=61149 RepID=A0A2P2Q9Q8_RHIMU